MKSKIQKACSTFSKGHAIFSETFFVLVVLAVALFFLGKMIALLLIHQRGLSWLLAFLGSALMIVFAKKSAIKKNRKMEKNSATQALFFFLKEKFLGS